MQEVRNGANPYEYPKGVLARINTQPYSKLYEPLPYNLGETAAAEIVFHLCYLDGNALFKIKKKRASKWTLSYLQIILLI